MYQNINKIYHAAIYVRLSKEDGDKVESDSIANQRDLIRHFLADKPDIQQNWKVTAFLTRKL